MNPKVAFFYPYRPANGVSALFVRLAKLLNSRFSTETCVIDFHDGFMSRQLEPSDSVELRLFSNDTFVDVVAGEILVLQGDVPYRIRRQLRISTGAKVVYWQLHPFNFIPAVIPIIGHRLGLTDRPQLYRLLSRALLPRQLKTSIDFVQLLNRRRSLFLMDETALRTTETYLQCRLLNPQFLPVALVVPDKPQREHRISMTVLNIAWIGRLHNFKIYILIHTIRRLIEVSETTNCCLIFHVIGGGPEERMLADVDPSSRSFELIRIADMGLKEMRDYLLERIDLVMAMGTAALEAAALGLPVILLDFSYSPIRTAYRFRWLQDAQGFDLGHPITTKDDDTSGTSLHELLAALQQDYKNIAAASYLYCRRNHNIDTVSADFMALVATANLLYGEIPCEMFQKSWIRRIYDSLQHNILTAQDAEKKA